MYLDAELEICTADDVYSTGSTVYAENDLDYTAVKNGSHEELWLTVRVSTAFSGGTSAEFKILTDSALPIDGSSTVLATSGAIAIASLTADTYAWRVKVPVGVLRYLSLGVTCVGTVTAGAIDCFLSDSIDDINYKS